MLTYVIRAVRDCRRPLPRGSEPVLTAFDLGLCPMEFSRFILVPDYTAAREGRRVLAVYREIYDTSRGIFLRA